MRAKTMVSRPSPWVVTCQWSRCSLDHRLRSSLPLVRPNACHVSEMSSVKGPSAQGPLPLAHTMTVVRPVAMLCSMAVQTQFGPATFREN